MLSSTARYTSGSEACGSGLEAKRAWVHAKKARDNRKVLVGCNVRQVVGAAGRVRVRPIRRRWNHWANSARTLPARTAAGSTARKIANARGLRATGTGPDMAMVSANVATAHEIIPRRLRVRRQPKVAPLPSARTSATPTAMSSKRGAMSNARNRASAAVTGATSSQRMPPKRAPIAAASRGGEAISVG